MSETEDTISMHMTNKSIWNVVNVLGQGVPIEMALRELVQNGFEACDRYETSFEKHVRVNKDPKGNIVITNYSGDFFSRDAAVNNLATLGNSGNSSNIASNFGIGAKISVLANNHEICYSSKKENEKNGISFTIGSIGPQDYGLKDFKDSSFSAKYNRNSVTSATIISGTGNTWNTLNEAVSPNKGVSGWGIAKFLSSRYFRTTCKLEVATYNKEGKKNKYRRIHGLQHCMKTTKRYESFKLVGGKIPEGVIVHWCILSDKRNSRNKLLSDYFIGFSLKNELLANLDDSFQSRTIDFTKCGVYSNASRLVVVFELPKDSNYIWTADRSKIICNSKEIRKEDFYKAFNKQMPEKIKALQNEEEYELDADSVRRDIEKELKDLFMPSLGPPPSPSRNKDDEDEDEDEKDSSSNTSSSGDTFRFSLSKIPKLEESNNKDAPTVSYLVDFNTIVVNYESATFKLRKKVIVENSDRNYSLLSDKEISGYITEEIYRGAVYHIAEFFKVNGKKLSAEEIEERLTPEALNCWSLPSIRAIRKRLTHRLNRAINSIDT